MIIDSHQHFWLVRRGDYPWLSPGITTLYRDYLPDDLRPLLTRNEIDRTILVQAAPTLAETDFLLDLASRTDFVAGVVGWLDLDSDGLDSQFDRYRNKPRFIGVRPALEFIPDDRFILRPRVLRNLETIADAEFPFDLIIHPRHLPAVLEMLDIVPHLRAVVDHIAKPDISGRAMEPWRTLLERVAGHQNVYCKLSGVVTQADHARWTQADIQPYIEHALRCFGPERVMFGSDWPVCLLAGSYEQTISTLRPALAELPDEHRWMIFGQNAARFYRLPIAR